MSGNIIQLNDEFIQNEMYLAGISMRRVESITEILWGQKVSAGTISNLNQKCFAQIEEWCSRKLTERYFLKLNTNVAPFTCIVIFSLSFLEKSAKR